jgi:hypothetical protein
LALGRDLSEIEAMPASEFQRWIAYYNAEPFGTWRDNFHIATLCALTANINRNPKKPPLSFNDFMFEDSQSHKRRKMKKMMSRFRSKAENNGE